MRSTISIVGCGWLGLPLAVALKASGWQVFGSTTKPEKLDLLQQNGIEPFLVDLAIANIKPDHPLLAAEVLLINIPPSLRHQTEGHYLEQLSGLAESVSGSAVKRVIFISSTSVYPELGATIADTEDVDSGSALYKAEQLFVNNKAFKTIVVRFGGLIGSGRNPARFFSGKKDIPNGLAPVNLIHLDDCIGLILEILNKDLIEGVFHAAAPSHPTKAEFYTEAAKAASVPLPDFKQELNQWKIIDPIKLQLALNYTFKYPDLLACLLALNK